MFGYGKQKSASLEEFCRNITGVLIKADPADLDSPEYGAMFTAEERTNITEELLIFRIVVLNFLLMFKAMQGKVKKKPYNIGLIVSNNTKTALKSIGFDKKMIEKFGASVLKEIEFQVKDLAERDLSNLDDGMLKELVCANFAKWLISQENNIIHSSGAQESVLLEIAAKVYDFTGEVFENAFGQHKVLK